MAAAVPGGTFNEFTTERQAAGRYKPFFMTTISELKSAFKETSKFIIGLKLTLLAISGYILQRSLSSFFLGDIETDQLITSMQQHQLTYSGLVFKYSTMNIFWPVIIAVFMFLIRLLLSKQYSIWSLIEKGEERPDTYFDSLNLYTELSLTKMSRFILWLSSYLPLLGLVSHILSAIWLLIHIISESTSNPDADEILIIQILLQFLTTLFCIIVTFKIPKFIINTIKAYAV
jgi:hypothetical protein